MSVIVKPYANRQLFVFETLENQKVTGILLLAVPEIQDMLEQLKREGVYLR